MRPCLSNKIFLAKIELLFNQIILGDIKHEKNKNGAAARNTGLKVAKGEYVTFLDDDDYFAKSKLERDSMYSQMLETYENVLNSDNSLETQKQSATEEITKIITLP